MSKSRDKTINIFSCGIHPVSFGLMAFLVFLPLYSTLTMAQDENAGIKFEVLDVTTGSGSKPKNSGDMPAVELPPGTVMAETDSSLNADSVDGEKGALYAALDRWHSQTLTGYNYAIGDLQDPFLPLKEVRGKPPVPGGGGPGPDEASLPPILRLDLNQLKLVAITILSDRPGGALVSFEDGAGASYILRQGDRIGRYKGRITKIEPGQVTVEEPDRLGAGQPQISEIKLNVLDTVTGVTRESEPEEGQAGFEQQPGQADE